MNTPITFPVSMEIFTAHQESCIGRLLSESEHEVIAVWLPIINGAYQEGASGNTKGIQDTTAWMWELITRKPTNVTLCRFLRATLLWILRAWKQGFTEYSTEKEDA